MPTLQLVKGFGILPLCSHDMTQWQIATEVNFANIVYDSGDDGANLTSLTVPEGELENNTTYYWRARFRSNEGRVSNWTAVTSFNTLPVIDIFVPCNWSAFSNSAPSDGVIASLMPTLEVTRLAGVLVPAPVCSHDMTQWQIATDANFANIVYDSGDDGANLTSLTIPEGRLVNDTMYYWRARFKSDGGAVSGWTATTRFTTVQAPVEPPGGGPPPPPVEPPPGGEGLSQFDTNRNCRIDDSEFFNAIDLWVAGEVSNELFFQVVDAWIAQTSVCAASLSTGKLSLEAVLLMVNPTTHTTTFVAHGDGITSMGVEIYDLNGQRIFSRETGRTRLVWNLSVQSGQPVANGVYLYVMTVRGANGETLRSEAKKLLILR
jgi:hypothetical protein